ncbi:hypothetical protein BM1_09067 [Bipolaris maydis]|nr:hypothetical protein BM1_09067 [Bipolaris maydis]
MHIDMGLPPGAGVVQTTDYHHVGVQQRQRRCQLLSEAASNEQVCVSSWILPMLTRTKVRRKNA